MIHARVNGKRGEVMVAYTDGGLDPGAEPKAGWGMTIQCQVDRWKVRDRAGCMGNRVIA